MAIQQQQPQQQEQWAPRFDNSQTRKLVKAYKSNPNIIPIEELRQHAAYHNVPFYEGDFSLYDAVKQLAGGFAEGFTTLKVVDPPDNEYEAIFRNIGHLAGFAPGIIAGPAKFLRLHNLAKAATALGEKSVPMWGARKITDFAKKQVVKPVLQASQAGRYQAMDTATSFLLGDKAKHIAEGAFHLGTASAISSVWDGVDGMMHSFFGGAVAGGVFRGIGGLIGRSTKDYKYPIETSEKAEKFVRGLAGSAFMGIPASIRGATTPEQIYEYLMGAYFGGKEMPFYKAQAGKFIQKMDKKALKDPKIG